MRSRSGFTLVELGVVMILIALIGSISVLAIGALRPQPVDTTMTRLVQARSEAIRLGKATSTGLAEPAVFLPDGRAIGRGLDPWTGNALRHGR